jgi:hypothetical protein
MQTAYHFFNAENVGNYTLQCNKMWDASYKLNMACDLLFSITYEAVMSITNQNLTELILSE